MGGCLLILMVRLRQSVLIITQRIANVEEGLNRTEIEDGGESFEDIGGEEMNMRELGGRRVRVSADQLAQREAAAFLAEDRV
jgi:hypothetical protein